MPGYNVSQYPMWGAANKAGLNNFKAADAGRNSLKGSGELAPVSQDWNRGYDAASSSLFSQTPDGRLNSHANGTFCNGQYRYPLYIYDVQLDLAITGATAQSRYTQDYYPQNMDMPNLTIMGMSYNLKDYGRLMEFIHASQHKGLDTTAASPKLMQFDLDGNWTSPIHGTDYDHYGLGVHRWNPQANKGKGVGHTNYTQSIVGPHHNIKCQGFIQSITRTHTTGVFYPQWQVSFTISDMLGAYPFHDSAVQDKETMLWMRLLSGTNSVNFTKKKGMLKTNRKNLDYAAKHTANVSLPGV